MKRTINKFVLSLAIMGSALSLQSCQKWLDINTNELAATEVEPDYIFNYAAASFSGNRMGGDVFMNMVWAAQTMSDGQYWFWGDDMYNLGQYPAGNTWVTGYASVGNNLFQAIGFAEELGRPDTQAQCLILHNTSVWMMTMCFGDIPVTQAWQIDEYPTPEFDAQKDVILNIIANLEKAVDLIDQNTDTAIDSYDIFYGGDMSKWRKMANSLRLRAMMFVANQEPSLVEAKIAALIAEGDFMTDYSEDFLFPYFDSPGNKNPTRRVFEAFGDAYQECFMANPISFDPMEAYNDPRMNYYFVDSYGVGYMAAIPAGDDAEMDDNGTPNDASDDLLVTSLINADVIFAADFPDQIFTASEAMFLVAEAYATGLGVAKDLATADIWYKKAVANACGFYGVSSSEISVFTENLPSLTTMSEDEALEAISTQFWIEAISRPVEAWANQRRTGYPVLEVPSYISSVYPDILRRWEYPSRESAVNPNVPQVEGVWEKSWFEQ